MPRMAIMDRGCSSLPPEILSEIFHLAKSKRRPTHLLPVEIVFSHVSLDWRTAILSDARAWNTINIHSPKSMERARAYLSRTGATLPLNVRVEIYDFDRMTRNSATTAAFVKNINVFLESCIHRCKTLLVFARSETTANAIVKGLETLSTPNLERLRVNTLPAVPDWEPVPLEHPDILVGGAPSLRFLETEAIHSFPPLENIITLHLHNLKPDWFTYDSFKQICTKATKLENLSLEAQSFIINWPTDVSGPTITLKSLRSLKIPDRLPGLIVKFLLSINAPRMESLWLSPDTASFDLLFDSPQFLPTQHKFSGVKHLTLDSYNMRDLPKFGKVFPNIETLYIPDAPMRYLGSTHFTEAFGSDPPLWPKLHTLAVSARSGRREAALKETLCNIVTRRSELRVGFKKFLADSDIIAYLHKQQSDLLNEHLEMEELDTSNYREPWWLMMHESHPDFIGLS